jgi:hypothetical protein
MLAVIKAEKVVVGYLFLVGMATQSLSQAAPQTLWDSPAQLRQWVFVAPASDITVVDMLEGSRDFVRIVPGHEAMIVLPNPTTLNLSNLTSASTVMDPSHYNALKITFRHNLPLSQLSGQWAHRSVQYDEDLLLTPKFSIYSAPGDDQWHTVVLSFADSPRFKAADPIVYINLSFISASSRDVIGLNKTASAIHLDIDRIEFIHADKPVPTPPTVVDFTPKSGPIGSVVAIQGSGFAQPADRNIVLFENEQAEIISGDVGHLAAKVPINGKLHVSVLTPGGLRASAQQTFITLGPPAKLTIVSGSGQSASIHTVLQPFSVRVSDIEDLPIPGAAVTFQITSGGGALSATDVTTNDQGIASVVLTLPSSSAVVFTRASAEKMFDTVTFIATATKP